MQAISIVRPTKFNSYIVRLVSLENAINRTAMGNLLIICTMRVNNTKIDEADFENYKNCQSFLI